MDYSIRVDITTGGGFWYLAAPYGTTYTWVMYLAAFPPLPHDLCDYGAGSRGDPGIISGTCSGTDSGSKEDRARMIVR